MDPSEETEAFVIGCFGHGRSTGGVLFFDFYLGESLETRDLDELNKAVDAQDEPDWGVSLLTIEDELVGISIDVPPDHPVSGDDWNGFQPSFVIRNEYDSDKPAFLVWLLAEKVTEEDTFVDLSDVLRRETDDDLANIDQELPLPGQAGWTLDGVDPHALVEGRVVTYTAEELMELTYTGGGDDDDPDEAPDTEPDIDPDTEDAAPDPFPPELMDRTLLLGRAKSAREAYWKNREITVRDFVDVLSAHAPTPKKDFKAVLQGAVWMPDGEKAGPRKSTSMVTMDGMFLDLDTGFPIDKTVSILKKAGLGGIIYSTFSHLKPATEVPKAEIIKWMRRQDEYDKTDPQPNFAAMRRYLLEDRKYNPDILADCTEADFEEEHKERIVCILQHKPMPKYRLVLFLDEQLVMRDLAADPQRIVMLWKAKYQGLASLLGLPVDQSCQDTARLLYLPSCPPDRLDLAEVHVVPGKALTWANVPEIDPRTGEVIEGTRNAWEEDAVAELTRKKRPDLKTPRLWQLIGASRGIIDINQLVSDTLGDEVRREDHGQGKLTIPCPREDAHSTHGDEDMGCYTQSPEHNDASSWAFHCRHSSCRDLDRVVLLDEFMIKYGLEVADIVDYCPELKEEEREKFINATALPKAFKDFDEAADFFAALKFDDMKGFQRGIDKLAVSEWMTPVYLDRIATTAQKSMKLGKRHTKSLYNERKQEFENPESKKEVNEYGIDEDSLKVLEKINKRHFVTKLGRSTVIGTEPRDPGGKPSFCGQQDFILEKGSLKVLKWNGKINDFVPHSAALAWLYDYPERRNYMRGVVFEPERRTKGVYNLWQGFPIEGDPDASWELLRRHIWEVLCHRDEEHYNFLMTWAADIFQNPGRKAGSAVVIKGKKGTGKSTFFHFLAQALGSHALSTSQREHVTGKFNAHMEALLLMVLEEAVWPGDHQGNSTIKDLITSEEIAVERKGVDIAKMNNYMRIGMTSNESWTVPATWDDERRFFVLKASEERQQDPDWFEPLYRQMHEGGGLAGMVWALRNWDPSLVGMTWEDLRRPPKTPWLAEEAREAIEPWKKFFLDWIVLGSFPTGPTAEGEDGELSEDETTIIPGKDIFEAFQSYSDRRARGKGSTQNYGIGMRDIMCADYVTPRSQRKWGIPPRAELLAALGAHHVALDLIEQENEV